MTRQQAEQFINAYNMLLTITTKGEDTKTMARVLDIMEQLANSIQLVEEPAISIEPVVEEAPKENEEE
jgi:hypothetical protein